MGRKLGYVLLVAALVIPAAAADKTGSIAGFVRNSAGNAQMGAVVEVFTRATQPLTVFTDDRGHFLATGLTPGIYHVKVSAPAFLPALRENVSLRPGAAVLVNITLNTLFEAMEMLPSRRNLSDEE
ncbi:MAG: carboxypeptidase-like regulatory domain-containing protein, partial [Terriglobales bacterium]